MWERLKAWLRALWCRRRLPPVQQQAQEVHEEAQPAPEPAAAIEPVVEAPPPAAPPPELEPPRPAKSRLRARRMHRVSHANLQDLLEHIDDAWDAVNSPIGFAQCDRAVPRVVHKIGVYVPQRTDDMHRRRIDLEDESPPRVDPSFLLPSMVAVSFACQDHKHDDDTLTVDLVVLTKIWKLPWVVARMREARECDFYQVDIAYRGKGEHSKTVWLEGYVSIEHGTGVLCFCQMIHQKPVHVTHHQGGHTYHDSYSKREWRKPFLLNEDDNDTVRGDPIFLDPIVRERWFGRVIAASIGAWCMRKKRWSVTVQKGKTRIVFGIAPSDTKHYFADRERDGNRRIFHLVQAHERHYRNGHVSQVEEHVRGQHKFQWHNYAVTIVPPERATWTAIDFPLPFRFEEHFPVGVQTISQLEGIYKLAKWEDGWRDKEMIERELAAAAASEAAAHEGPVH